MCELSSISTGIPTKIQNIRNVRDRCIALLCWQGLKLSDIIDLTNETLPKFSKEIQQHLRVYIAQYKPQHFLFFTRQSPQLTARRIQQILKEYDIEPQRELRKQQILQTLKRSTVQEIKKQFHLTSLREKVILSEQEIQTLLSTVSGRDRYIIQLILETGITLNQLIHIKQSDIHSNQLAIRIQDGRFSHEQETYTLSQQLLASLAHLAKAEYLFSTKNGPLSHRRIQQILKQYSETIGKELTPQILRNTYLAKEVEENVSARTIYEGYHCGGEHA